MSVQDVLPHIAERYQVSRPTVDALFASLTRTGGHHAQFDAPELGGMGQWMPGMIMVGRMQDDVLRNRVAGLCAELAALVQGSDTAAEEALAAAPASLGTAPRAGPAGESWWPATLGHPAQAGDQDGIRYAYFPDKHRLVTQTSGRIDCYHTGPHRITGFAQRMPGTPTLVFRTDRGFDVTTADLKPAELC